jgi:hypothetical protein
MTTWSSFGNEQALGAAVRSAPGGGRAPVGETRPIGAPLRQDDSRRGFFDPSAWPGTTRAFPSNRENEMKFGILLVGAGLLLGGSAIAAERLTPAQMDNVTAGVSVTVTSSQTCLNGSCTGSINVTPTPLPAGVSVAVRSCSNGVCQTFP